MLIIKDISNLQSYLSAYQNRKYSIGYVPTMGALHKGHGELIKQSKKDNHKTIVSIFVNEKQFSSKEDFETYPWISFKILFTTKLFFINKNTNNSFVIIFF